MIESINNKKVKSICNILNKIDNVVKDRIFKLAYLIFISVIMLKDVDILYGKLWPIRVTSYVLFILSGVLYIHKYDLKTLIKILITTALVIPATYLSDSSVILSVFIIVMTSYSIKMKSFIRFDLIIKSILTILLIYLYYHGYIREAAMGWGKYGFLNINTCACYLFSILIELVYVLYDKLKYLSIIIIPLVSLLIYKYTMCRTVLYLCAIFYTLYLILLIFKKHILYRTRVFKFIFLISFTLCLGVSIYVTHMYNYGYMKNLNTLTTGRVKHMSNLVNTYNIKIFGNRIDYVYAPGPGQKQLICDNAYINLLITYGVVVMILYITNIFNSFRKVFDKEDYLLAIILLVYILYGLSETYLFKLPYNPFLLVMGYSILNKPKESK